MSSSGDGPEPPAIVRPIPRRPFELHVSSGSPTEATTPEHGNGDPDPQEGGRGEEEEDFSSAPPSPNPETDWKLHLAANPRLAELRQHALAAGLFPSPPPSSSSDAGGNGNGGNGSGSLSRAQSIMNLTASTLFGIYSPTTANNSRRPSGVPGSGGGGFYWGDEPGTPWGTGAETPPVKRPSVDENTYELMRKRMRGSSGVGDGGGGSRDGHGPSRRSSTTVGKEAPGGGPPLSRPALALSLAARAGLLFALGMGYGVLVSRLRSEHRLGLSAEDEPGAGAGAGETAASSAAYHDYCDWRYLAFWGACGVLLGTLLPWFDGIWDRAFGGGSRSSSSSSADDNRRDAVGVGVGAGAAGAKEANNPDTDWALVVRGVGAFVGIVFAIRKLPWASTMQVSLTLALVNPFLWYLIDRSKSGFLLSAAVGLAGSAVLTLLDLEVMPSPAASPAPAPASFATAAAHVLSAYGGGGGGGGNGNGSQVGVAAGSGGASGGASASGGTGPGAGAGPLALGGLARQETVEAGIWMLTLLFCSCLCFGNIGRRLALSPSARGRWGGVR